VFLDGGLCCVYLELLAEHAGRNRLRVLAYCLMTNHVHLVVVPETERSLANTFRHAHARFSQYWNTEFHRTGHLWQNRFYSCPIEEAAAWRVVRYVEQNPVRAGMVETAAAYAWSSAAAHVGLEASPVLDCDWWNSMDGGVVGGGAEGRRRRSGCDPAGDVQRPTVRIRRVRASLGNGTGPETGATQRGPPSEETRGCGSDVLMGGRAIGKRLVRHRFCASPVLLST
jgi:REP element-mobilizing transposase RayT